jgi:hypothetical protein
VIVTLRVDLNNKCKTGLKIVASKKRSSLRQDVTNNINVLSKYAGCLALYEAWYQLQFQGATTFSITTFSIMTFSVIIQHNDIQHNHTQRKDIQYNKYINLDTQHNNAQHDNTLHWVSLCWMSFMLNVSYAECHLCWMSVMLSVIYAAECH